MKAFLQLVLSAVVVFSFCSCGRQMSSDVYAGPGVGESAVTYNGTVVHVRQVTVQGAEDLSGNTMGLIGGGVAGALVGSAFGKGSGKIYTTIGGAALGATAGAFTEKKLSEQDAMEYIVELDNGQTRTVVQGMDPRFSVGQKVYVMVGDRGRARVIAR